jgi:hypothetical protein
MDSQDATIEKLVRVNLETADRTPSHAKRGQHPKHHGCVEAAFSIGDWIPDRFKIGIFAKPATFRALIRFSNGRVWDDRKSDAHGMAIKLLDVPGVKLIPGHEHESAVDFVLVDSEVFFSGDLAEYLFFTAGILKSRSNPVYAVYFWTAMILFRLPLLRRVLAFIGRKPVSPLGIAYYSSVPYRFGEHVVKYICRPRDHWGSTAPLADADGLARALIDTLAVGTASFDFGIDIQCDTNLQPVENPTINWSDQLGARREWLGIISIPAQDVDPNSALAENLAFSPWHTIRSHEPIGAINLARMPVYLKMSTLRHELNGVVPPGTSEAPPS